MSRLVDNFSPKKERLKAKSRKTYQRHKPGHRYGIRNACTNCGQDAKGC